MVRTFCLRLVGAAFISALSVIAGHAAEAVYPTGSRIGLEPARGLSASERFPGFEDKAAGPRFSSSTCQRKPFPRPRNRSTRTG